MRAIWNGVVSFGLVSVPVRLYPATTDHDVRFHQVHQADGGQIRYRRVCEVCSQEVAYAEVAKGYQTKGGELVTLDADDLASLPLSSSRDIEVVEFVPAEQVDTLLLDRAYYLEPEARAVKPYLLLREALRQADRMAVVKMALRQRETLAVLRVRDSVIVLQTMLWPDEVRTPEFDFLDEEAAGGVSRLQPQELELASLLVGSLGGDFDPEGFEDRYKAAVEDLIEYKRTHGGARPVPVVVEGSEPITDLLTALRRSVEEARSARGVPPDQPAADIPAPRSGSPAKKKKPAGVGKGRKTGAKADAAKKAGRSQRGA